MNFWTQVSEQIRNIWQKLTTWQKFTLAGILALFLIVVVIVIFANRPQMEVLYSGLNPETAAAMTAKLKEQKVPYKLVDDGRTILVNAKDKYQLRLDMVNEVNFSGVVGFESFNETRFGETDTDKRVRFLVALQGELTRTIEELDEVDKANVHIALPQPSLFIRDEKEATASVLLRLKPYATLDPAQVKSIMSFVSHSVEGLKESNVTVMDVKGNLLSEGIADDSELASTKISANQLALKKEYEKELGQSILSMLERMRGPGKAVVRASVEMDFDKVETLSETYGEPVIRSEQIREESYSGSSPSVGGNPADSNMTGITYGTTGGTGNSEHELSEQVRNYEISKVTETKVVAPGKVKKLSLSVIVDGELTPEEENKIQDAVAMAAGIDPERGDQLSVVGMPFSNTEAEELEKALAKRETFERWMEFFKVAVIPLTVLLIFAFVAFMLKRHVVQRQGGPYPGVVSQEEMAAQGESEEGVELNLSPEALEQKNLEKQIENLVRTKPEDVAKVIKTWLVEE